MPAARMKTSKPHRVPLSEAAITVLRVSAQRAAWSRIAPTALIFSSLKRDQPMNDMTVGAVLKRMGPADLAPHGFRASFRDRAAELTDAPNHVALNMRGALDRKQSRSRVTARRLFENGRFGRLL